MEVSEERPAEVDDAAAPATADDDEEDDEEEATTTTATTTEKKKKRRKAKGAGAGAGAGGGNHQVYISPAYQANLRITSSPSSGRCTVAARDLQPGDLIFEEEPVALVLFQQHQGAACHYCGRGPVRQVEGSYPCCSPECFSKRQMAHQLARHAFLQVEEIGLEEDVDAELLRMVILLACKRHIFLNFPAIAGEEGPRIWASVDSLMDHREHMTPEFLACITKGLSRAMEHLPANVRLTPEEAVRLACIVNVNSHATSAPTSYNTTIGIGLYPLLAMLNHSCRPNCHFFFEDGVMKVRALEQVKDSKELFVPYVNLLNRKELRQEELRKGKHFQCQCVRCASDDQADILLGGLCCAQCGDRGLLVDPSSRLNVNGKDVESNGVNKGKKKKKKGGQVMVEAKKDEVDEALAALDLQDKAAVKQQQEGAIGTERSQRHCDMCNAHFTEEKITSYLRMVEADKTQAMVYLQNRSYESAKRHLDILLLKHCAVTASASSSSGEGVDGAAAVQLAAKMKGNKSLLMNKSRIRLHPHHQIIIECLPHVINCCNHLKEYGVALPHFRRILTVMSSVYSPNFPELGDYHHSFATAIFNHLKPRLSTFPRKTLGALKAEMKTSITKACEIRAVALGPHHPLTLESQKLLQLVTTGGGLS